MSFSVVNISKVAIVDTAKVKAIGMPIGGGVPQDGDGDGKYSLPGGEDVIPMPVLPKAIEKLWGAENDARIKSRRNRLSELAKRKKSLKPVAKLSEIDAMYRRGDIRGIRSQMKAMFEHNNLGNDKNVSSKLTSVSFAPGPYNIIEVQGEFRDDKGKVVGYFSRRVFTDKDERRGKFAEPNVYLSLLNMRAKGKDFSGAGIGRDFGMLTDEQFRRTGLKHTTLVAGLRDGPFIWAKEGFDWTGYFDRQDFLDALDRRVKKIKEDKEVSKYFKTPAEYAEFIKLIKKANEEEFDDKTRLTPYAFTLFSGAREFFKTLTDEEGNAFSWSGKRNL